MVGSAFALRPIARRAGAPGSLPRSGDRLDTGHGRRAELGRLAVVNVEYLATQMGQAGSFSNGAALVDLVVAAETVGLERAGKSGELGHHALAGAAHGGAIPGDRRLLRTRVASSVT